MSYKEKDNCKNETEKMKVKQNAISWKKRKRKFKQESKTKRGVE